MTITFTITDNTPQSLAFVEYIKKLDFIKITKIKEEKTYRDEIMALSKKANSNMTKRWEKAIAKKEQKYDSNL